MARIDIVCSVVDNFGDAGFCWRLARQLAREHRIGVRVWTDRQDLFERLARGDEPARAAALDLAHAGIEVGPIEALDACIEPGQFVVTLFDARLPASFAARLRARSPNPPEVHVEYLSAEPWIDACHGLHSLRTDGSIAWMFLPGFSAASGGLVREHDLDRRRECFLASHKHAWLARAGVSSDARIATLFAYPDAPIQDWLEALGREGGWTVLAAAGGSPFPTGRHRVSGVEVIALPFLAQPAFDELLWASDFAFVRGEDSWIRAHWARIPFVWAPYRQSDRLHLKKLDAFLDRFLDASAADDPASAAAIRAVSHAWSEDGDIDQAWRAYRERLESIAALHRVWTDTLAARTDLASNLMTMLRSRANC
ncbi:MAG: elongation factor P maturation arginine rhamnosyltransferase EarP [Burkholderiaceae bacterium]|nr:elongation factor P maturation arginine rhamnosyltransferase EarP [Burkholderiaceae bacterium]